MSASSVEPACTGHDPSRPVFLMHRGGKLEVVPRLALRDRADLSLAYSPGVAEVSLAIAAEPALVDTYTGRANTVAVVSDGTAVLGLGDVGPRAAMPVMEGKALLFKHFAGVDAVPICLDTTDVEEIVDTVARMAPTFGGVNLEDISAPRCFEVERRLQERLDVPVFHDDQHGTAIVTLAGLVNAAQVVGKDLAGLRVVVSGAGAAGVAVAAILRRAGVLDVVVCDSRGVVEPGRADLPDHKRRLAATTNPRAVAGSLADALVGADVYVGVSGGTVPEEAVAAMADDAIVFALANPDPEVTPEVAARHAAVVGTGRSDYPNQINNVLAFPGVFRGALDVRARRVTEGMKLAAARAIADVVEHPSAGEVVPSVFDERVAPAVAAAVAAAARREGVARR
ncbi:NADP-dependent malic enzyme [Kineosporiaceae bacterium SCSIO 59966]|nr:NADP-dependent malic enzyme [Kineosporiaceae bacterium SCSIO 59966]